MNENVIEQDPVTGFQSGLENLLMPEERTEELPHETVGKITVDNPRIVCRNVDIAYSGQLAIRNASIDIGKNEVIAMIGPSGMRSRHWRRIRTDWRISSMRTR